MTCRFMKQREERKLWEFITSPVGKTTIPKSSLLLKNVWNVYRFVKGAYVKSVKSNQLALHEKIANGNSRFKTCKN